MQSGSQKSTATPRTRQKNIRRRPRLARQEITLEIMERLLTRHVPISVSGESKQVTATEAIVLQLMQKAIAGNARAWRALLPTGIPTKRSNLSLSKATTRRLSRNPLRGATMASHGVGYGKPPESGRFRAGASGNPKGRPKRKRTPLAEIIKNALNAPIEYRERGRTKVATFRELSLKTLVDHAVNGDLGAAELALKILSHAERHGEPGVEHIMVDDWLADYAAQTAEQKTADVAKGRDAKPAEWWRSRPPVIRLSNGGRLDFWSLENSIAGRGRRYRRIVIDEAAFTKDGDNRTDDSMMALWEKGIKPTLFDYGGEALVCSNSAGRNQDNFFYNICTDPQYGFHEFHATTMDNPLLPKRSREESDEAWVERRAQFHVDLIRENDPLVHAQEYLAEFVDWSGVAFFSREKLLIENQPLPFPAGCESVFAIVDTASKTGTDNDATAVTFFAYDRNGKPPLLILDWDIAQIEGATLETWLPGVFASLEEFAGLCRARRGSIGAFIEDKNSGTILLQQAQRRQMLALAIDSKLTAMGKDERAISVSGYVHRGMVKYTERAFHKTAIYKRHSRNHLLDQVESFRVGDKGSDREDDLLDTFCYGIALTLGNSDGF
jgi:Family of unknown function (DUF5681)